MEKLLHLVAAILFLRLETHPAPFWVQKLSPPPQYPLETKGISQEGVEHAMIFPLWSYFPWLQQFALLMQMVGNAVSSGPSGLKAGKLQSASLHRQPCFADFPTRGSNSINVSQDPETRVTTNYVHQSKHMS